MRFRGLDLNLLVAFDALVEVRHVTRAADRLNLSQSAMSTILGRLRDSFKDPILILHGKTMVPTAYALRIQPAVRAILESVEHLMASAVTFDPAQSQRTFRVGCSDFLATVVFAPFFRMLRTVAPGLRFEISAANDQLLEDLERGVLDFIAFPEFNLSPNHPTELLFEEKFVIQGWRNNPLFDQPITVDDFNAAGHVSVKLGQRQPRSFAEIQLAHLGIERRVEVQVEGFSLVPLMLVESMRIAIVHERMARFYEQYLPLRSCDPPFALPLMREMVQFHSARADDQGLRWVLDCLRDFVTSPIIPERD